MSDDSADLLAAWAAGRLPDGVAAMRLLYACATGAEARVVAAGAGAGALRPLLTDEAHALVKRLLSVADHASPANPQGWAERFDRAAELSPDASVALYSLGDPVRLARATAEVVDFLKAEEMLGPERRVLEIGCGNGRFVRALAPLTALTVGVDVSPVMLQQAAARIAREPGAALVRTGGADLAAFRSGTVDLVLAIDSWPYVVDSGLQAAMFGEAARVLSAGGDLVVLNWSYRGDEEGDRAEAAALAATAGLRVDRRAGPSLSHWNGALYRFSKT